MEQQSIPPLEITVVPPYGQLPTRGTEGSAGYDLYAAIPAELRVEHGQITKVPVGIAVAIPAGYCGLIFASSGMGINHGVIPAHAVGVIDSDYRGAVNVGLTCHLPQGYTITPGQRIAQLVLTPVLTPRLLQVESLSDTTRGTGGFGSTGK